MTSLCNSITSFSKQSASGLGGAENRSTLSLMVIKFQGLSGCIHNGARMVNDCYMQNYPKNFIIFFTFNHATSLVVINSS